MPRPGKKFFEKKHPARKIASDVVMFDSEHHARPQPCRVERIVVGAGGGARLACILLSNRGVS